MRTAAEVGERALRISGDMAVLQFGDQFAFICLPLVAKSLEGIGLGDGLLHERFFLRTQFHHLVLNGGKAGVVDDHALGGHHVIVESVLDSRSYTELDTRIEFLQRLGHEVRRGVPESVLRFGIVPLVQLNSRIGLDGLVELYDLVIDTGAKDVLRETGADRLSNLKRRHTAFVLTDRVVRKSNFNHI